MRPNTSNGHQKHFHMIDEENCIVHMDTWGMCSSVSYWLAVLKQLVWHFGCLENSEEDKSISHLMLFLPQLIFDIWYLIYDKQMLRHCERIYVTVLWWSCENIQTWQIPFIQLGSLDIFSIVWWKQCCSGQTITLMSLNHPGNNHSNIHTHSLAVK